MTRGGAWPFRLATDGGCYGLVSTSLSTKDATAPFASSGALELMLHWPFFGPDLYLGPNPAKRTCTAPELDARELEFRTCAIDGRARDDAACVLASSAACIGGGLHDAVGERAAFEFCDGLPRAHRIADAHVEPVENAGLRERELRAAAGRRTDPALRAHHDGDIADPRSRERYARFFGSVRRCDALRGVPLARNIRNADDCDQQNGERGRPP